MPETKTLAPIDEICNSLQARIQSYAAALPPHITPEKFVRVAQTAIRMEPKLATCDRNSLYGSFLRCATDGLIPDGREAAIVPWGETARYMPMIAGICKKIRNSGEIGDIDAQVVHKNDEYQAWIDEKGRHFKWSKARTDRGDPLLTFAYALARDGIFYFEEVDETEMQKIESMARAKDTPWKGPFRNEMKRKSALRRLAKYRLPQSTDLVNLTQTEDDLYDVGKQAPSINEVPGSANRLKGLIHGQIASNETPSEVAIEFPDKKAEAPI